MKFSLAALTLLVSVANSSFAQDLTGSVKDMQGRPLANVFVYSYPTILPKPSELSPYQYTDKRGFFRFGHPGKILFFVYNGFRPSIYLLLTGNNHIDVILEDARETEWIIPSCQKLMGNVKYLGTKMKVIIPGDTHLLQEQGPDSTSTTIEHRATNKTNRLTVWASISGGDFPNENLILSTTKLFTRALKNKEDYGVEFRGESANGEYWRHVSFGFYTFTYHNVSKEAAQFFDEIIDSLCIGQ